MGTHPFVCIFPRVFFLSTVKDHRNHHILPKPHPPHVVSVGCHAIHDACPKLAGLVSDGCFSAVSQNIAEQSRGVKRFILMKGLNN
jgi:hypothetical protein